MSSLWDSTFPHPIKVNTSNWFIPLPSPAMQLESACSVSTSASFKPPQSPTRSTDFSLGCTWVTSLPLHLHPYLCIYVLTIPLQFHCTFLCCPPTASHLLLLPRKWWNFLNERCNCQVHCDIRAIQDFRFDKPFILPKALCMESPSINIILLSLVLFGFLWNWTLQIVWMAERRTDPFFQAQSLPLE